MHFFLRNGAISCIRGPLTPRLLSDLGYSARQRIYAAALGPEGVNRADEKLSW
jgi:hypothetical protein